MPCTAYCLPQMIVLVGFAQAFYLISTQEYVSDSTGRMLCQFCSIQDAMHTLFRLSIGDADYETTFARYDHQLLGSTLFLLYSVFSIVLLLNLLIALFAESFAAVSGKSHSLITLQRARFILLLERRLSLWLWWRQRRPRTDAPADGAADEQQDQQESAAKSASTRSATWRSGLFSSSSSSISSSKFRETFLEDEESGVRHYVYHETKNLPPPSGVKSDYKLAALQKAADEINRAIKDIVDAAGPPQAKTAGAEQQQQQ